MKRIVLASVFAAALASFPGAAAAQTLSPDPAFKTPRAETCQQKNDGYYCAWGMEPEYAYLCRNGTVVGWRPCLGGCDPKSNVCVRPGRPVGQRQ